MKGSAGDVNARRESPARKEKGGGEKMIGAEREGLSGISGGEDIGSSSNGRNKGTEIEVPLGVPLPKGMLNVPGLRVNQNEKDKGGRSRGVSGGGGVSTGEGTEGEERGTPVRGGRRNEKGRGIRNRQDGDNGGRGKAVDGDTSLEDVFTYTRSTAQPALSSKDQSTAPFPSNQTPRRPRHQRTRSEPLSIISGFDGEASPARQSLKTSGQPGGGEKGRKKRKKKEKDKEGEAVGDSTDGDLVSRLKRAGLSGNGKGEDAISISVKPRMIGLRMPLTEEDDAASVISAMDNDNTSDDQQHDLVNDLERSFVDRYTAVKEERQSDYASLSKSAPGEKSYLMNMNARGGIGRGGDGYTSASGYQSGGGFGEGERSGVGKNDTGRRSVVEDESAVWEMPGEEERGSGAGLTVSSIGFSERLNY